MYRALVRATSNTKDLDRFFELIERYGLLLSLTDTLDECASQRGEFEWVGYMDLADDNLDFTSEMYRLAFENRIALCNLRHADFSLWGIVSLLISKVKILEEEECS